VQVIINSLPIKLLIVLDLGIRLIRGLSLLPSIDHVFDGFWIVDYLFAVGVVGGREVECGKLDLSLIKLGIPS
jgi:hypothetical protein